MVGEWRGLGSWNSKQFRTRPQRDVGGGDNSECGLPEQCEFPVDQSGVHAAVESGRWEIVAEVLALVPIQYYHCGQGLRGGDGGQRVDVDEGGWRF